MRTLRHFGEMLAAITAGMVVLGALRIATHPALVALEMAFDMSVGMVVWMRFRGHGWAAALEMVAAMFVPALVLAPLSWLGMMSGSTLMVLTHVAMLPLMALVMLRRREEYAR